MLEGLKDSTLTACHGRCRRGLRATSELREDLLCCRLPEDLVKGSIKTTQKKVRDS